MSNLIDAKEQWQVHITFIMDLPFSSLHKKQDKSLLGCFQVGQGCKVAKTFHQTQCDLNTKSNNFHHICNKLV